MATRTTRTRKQDPRTETPTDDLLSPREAARLLGVQPRTLRAWRRDGREIPFVRLSCRCIRYRRRDVERFIDARRIGGGGNGDD
jgi:excisionase family DNA binding protein